MPDLNTLIFGASRTQIKQYQLTDDLSLLTAKEARTNPGKFGCAWCIHCHL